VPGPGGAERRERTDGLLTTGDMALLTGSTLRTVRFYEEAGILCPDRRSAGGHRLFGRRELERLQFITDMRATGLSLDEIRELLDAKKQASNGQQAASQVVAAMEPQLAALAEKIETFTRLKAELLRTRQILDECLECKKLRNYPAACQGCEVVTHHDPLPPSFRVLWL
jgi:MerR family Zn(II)-responsive transcriptional regulator of zntA